METKPLVHVAYADDHIAVRKGIISFIENLGGISVDIEADNGRDLISQLNKALNLPDVIMLDIQMPYMDGFETMSVLKEKWPTLKTLVLTAFGNEMYLIQMVRLGANGYVLKNCHPEELKEAIISIHENGYYYANSKDEYIFEQALAGKIKLPNFTNNELEYLKYCVTDLTYSEIAIQMGITVKAIEGYVSRLCEKLHVKGRIGLAMRAVELGIVKAETKPPTRERT